MKAKMRDSININQLKQFSDQLKKRKNAPEDEVKKLVIKQADSLLNDVGPNLVYANRINRIIATTPKLNKEQAMSQALSTYEYFYLEGARKVHHIVYLWSKVMKSHHGQKHVNMYEIADNVLLKRFGLGNPYRVLDVHSNGGGNVPMMVVITYV